MKLTVRQEKELLLFLWDYMLQDCEHKDRVYTGYGSKTREGLLRSIESLLTD